MKGNCYRLDVKVTYNTKVVLIIRREPQQDEKDSVFGGSEVTEHSYIRTKVAAAKDSKVAAIIMVNGPFSTRKTEEDLLTDPGKTPVGFRGTIPPPSPDYWGASWMGVSIQGRFVYSKEC